MSGKVRSGRVWRNKRRKENEELPKVGFSNDTYSFGVIRARLVLSRDFSQE